MKEMINDYDNNNNNNNNTVKWTVQISTHNTAQSFVQFG